MLASLRRSNRHSQDDRRFSNASGTNQQGICAPFEAAAEHLVEFRVAALDALADKCRVVFRSDQTWINFKTTPLDREIMISAAKVNASHFHYIQSPTLRSIINS